jgi:hypothetical protein
MAVPWHSFSGWGPQFLILTTSQPFSCLLSQLPVPSHSLGLFSHLFATAADFATATSLLLIPLSPVPITSSGRCSGLTQK